MLDIGVSTGAALPGRHKLGRETPLCWRSFLCSATNRSCSFTRSISVFAALLSPGLMDLGLLDLGLLLERGLLNGILEGARQAY
jgi:hypothetical protein